MVMISTIVGSVRRWLLDRCGTIRCEVLHFGTLNLRPDDPIEVPREILLAHVDCYQRNKDLAQVRIPGSLQKKGTESRAYRTSDERENDKDDLLPRCEGAQVHGDKSGTRDPADAEKESVDIFDVECSIRCREYARGDDRNKCTSRKYQPGSISHGANSQEGKMNPIEIEVTAKYRSQAPLGFCHVHIHSMGRSVVKLRNGKVCEMIHRPSESRSLVKSWHVPMR